ncbi:hypothetical protein [Leptospira neocaledonica]|uniref:Uncharacterized protein n=1 Tax=Leptospira neocaledonica TaxID=2023192 RepID=A0A2M9ZTV7_9LEPT|nr:hypothetical protein [Leptospira neocaledonica]PJZ75409.1 hypothetical protein CH365_18905 [Leptospira neocaledonica]
MLILGQDSGNPILIWPEFSWTPVISGAIFLVLLFTVIYLLQRYLRGQNRLALEYRAKIVSKLQLHHFNSKDTNLFHTFLDQVDNLDLKRLAEDPSWYRKHFLPEFLQFLAEQSNLPAWKDILIIHTLDHLIEDHKTTAKNFITAILETDSEERFPALLGIQELDENSLNKAIRARIYTKKVGATFSLTRYERMQILIPDENKQWLKSEAILISQEGTNLTLQIKTVPELDEKKTEEWIETPKTSPAGPAHPSIIPDEYVNSLAQILEYSGLHASTCEEITRLVHAYKEHPGLIRRRHRQEDYKILIRLYKVCFIKFRSQTTNIPKPVLLFIYFFFLDEGLLSAKRLQDLELAIATLKSSMTDRQYQEVKLSIHLLPDWLNLILAGKKNPSQNHMGQTYDQIQKSNLRWNQEPEAKNIMNKEYLLHILDWELENILYMGLLGISLNPNFAYPILSEDQFYGATEANLTFTDKILSNAERVSKIDTSIFQRQVTAISNTDPSHTEQYRKEFFADCILLPYSGNRGVLWQETSIGNQDYSRLLFPVVMTENATLVVTKTLGEFRWETERSMRGRKWKDPIPASLTSEYYSYLENFQKNPNLTIEAKKRIEQQWVKVGKNIKDMFSIDYAYWILLEAEGKPRLNRVVREILNRFVPIQIKS